MICNKMIVKRLFALCFCFVFAGSVFSQSEYVSVLPTKQVSLKAQNSNSTLKVLPFFDDFAYSYTVPLQTLWQDDDAYVNTAFAKNMITIGVASLDAMNRNGKLHESVGVSASVADYLTSVPINLKTYEKTYYSDKLYVKSNSTFNLLSDSYYLFDKEQNTYVSVKQRLAYKPGDTLYLKENDVFVAKQDSLYDDTKTYIEGSYKNEHQWFTYSLADSIALSFAYEAGGVVDTPEKTDSLVLEFYVPYDTTGFFINEITTSGLELYNATDSTISLDGYLLSFDEAHSSYVTLKNVDVTPFQHVVITPKEVGLDSYTVALAYLYSPDTVNIDSIVVKETLGTDYAYARLTDGNPIWSYTATITLGECNPSWKWIWSTSESTNNEFTSVYIPIDEISYLVKGFRFRFKNYASLSNDESHARNEDFWHLDMIWLDANRCDTIVSVPDVAFTTEISPLYSRYKALPMTHFSKVTNSDFRMTIPATFSNFDSEYRKLKFYFSVEKSHANEAVTFATYETDMPPQETVTERDILTDFDVEFYDFLAEDVNVYQNGEYDFKYYYTDINNSLNSQYRWNDTCRVKLTLSNYYAYDDGTPEAGYGLRDAPMGRVAFRFDMLQPDTLKAIAMYFNPTLLETATTFNLCVWSNDNGLPGDLLYYSPSEKVAYADGIYEFVDYEIKPDCIVSGEAGLYVPKSYFIGWEQPNDVLLNIGIDLNSSVTKRLYYNLGFEWESSVQTGALLMRPIVGTYDANTSVDDMYISDIQIYPTIASSNVIIQSNEEIAQICVYDLNGACVLVTSQSQFSVASLANGIYVVIITTQDGKKVMKKMVKTAK